MSLKGTKNSSFKGGCLMARQPCAASVNAARAVVETPRQPKKRALDDPEVIAQRLHDLELAPRIRRGCYTLHFKINDTSEFSGPIPVIIDCRTYSSLAENLCVGASNF
ncbi:hypothetical protein DSO57_1007419 [Entomophthora muscae]|uniref:Uncharacterized protein n=1 Tax=Entomophthora muscae TaxID=34485 RepID=A0ACC2SKB8_9FUNG|nr:hypothetical protein DSO57_1007419 [Entomophthora muscae]